MDAKYKEVRVGKSAITTAILGIVILILIVFPEAKALLIVGFMKVGLFQPALPSTMQIKTETHYPLVPDLRFRTVNDSSINLGTLRGKTIFINFWATWCPPCIAEIPGINSLYQKLRHDSTMVFLMADVDGNFVKSKKFLANRNADLPLVKAEVVIPENIFSGTLPTTLVINKKGEIVFHEQGVANYGTKKFEAFLVELSAE
jgi:thiol-disulfide isomerase/thioredoxin